MQTLKIEAQTVEHASEVYCAMRDESGEGASTFPCGEWNGLHISYNGRVWNKPSRLWRSGDVPVFDPCFIMAMKIAVDMLNAFGDLEIRSALKRAGHDCGIACGDEMDNFVLWAEKKMGL